MVSRYDEYVICKQRGHGDGDLSLDFERGHFLIICDRCDTHYRHEQQLVEDNVPDPPEFGT